MNKQWNWKDDLALNAAFERFAHDGIERSARECLSAANQAVRQSKAEWWKDDTAVTRLRRLSRRHKREARRNRRAFVQASIVAAFWFLVAAALAVKLFVR